MNLPGTEKVIDGTRMYVNGDRQFIAEVWDKMFLPAVTIKPNKNKKYKGESPDRRNSWKSFKK